MIDHAFYQSPQNARQCATCGKSFKLFQAHAFRSADGTLKHLSTRSASISGADPEGFFCTLRCAARFGISAVRQLRPWSQR